MACILVCSEVTKEFSSLNWPEIIYTTINFYNPCTPAMPACRIGSDLPGAPEAPVEPAAGSPRQLPGSLTPSLLKHLQGLFWALKANWREAADISASNSFGLQICGAACKPRAGSGPWGALTPRSQPGTVWESASWHRLKLSPRMCTGTV